MGADREGVVTSSLACLLPALTWSPTPVLASAHTSPPLRFACAWRLQQSVNNSPALC